MQTKTEIAVNYWINGKQLKALAIFRTFKIGITAEEKRVLEIAHESQNGKENYYLSLGINTTEIKQQSIEIINSKFINKK